MKSLEILGRKKKEEFYPDYEDLTDLEVGRAFKLEYPDRYRDYDEAHLVSKAKELQEYYNPRRGKFTSWWQGGKSEARAKLQTVLSQEQMVVLQQAADYEQAVIDGKMRIAAYNSYLAQHQFQLGQLKANAILISEALAEGYTHENWQFEKISRAQHEREQESRNAEHQFKLELLETEITLKLSQTALELDIFKQKEAIKLNNQIEEWRQQVRFSLMNESMNSIEKKIMIQEKLDEMYKQIEQIENSSYTPTTKRRMIEGREELISQFINFRNSL